MKYAVPAALVACAVLAVSACKADTPPPAQDASSSAAKPGAADGPFAVPAEQLAHLKIAAVHVSSWASTVRTTGTVDWDNDHTTQAITQVSGPIARILVDTGARVKAGDPLLAVASADITNSISAYRKAKNRFDLAQRTLDRSKDLLAHKAISPRDMENAEADYNDAATDLQTTLVALKIFGVSSDDLTEAERQNVAIRPELMMRAPLAGTIVQKMVLPGQFIQAGATPAFVISNTSTVWVQGHVYDKDLAAIQVGDAVDERNSSFPQTFHGVVSNIGDMLDPATRTTPVRIVTQNIDSLLKKDLFVDITIHGKGTHDVLTVPTAAVLYDEQNFPFVYIQMAPGRFAERRITIGQQQDADTQIVDGLKAGDMVVSEGSVFLQFANSNQQ
jgi:membrane fusion protein, heavy metal efflux system